MRWFHYSAHGAGKLNGPAFSGSFIVDQKQLELPYGRYGSAAAGCGWIAVYNALQILGIDADMEKIRSDMEKLLFLGGWRATPFYVPALYFRHKGQEISGRNFILSLPPERKNISFRPFCSLCSHIRRPVPFL